MKVAYDTISNVYCIEIGDGNVARTVEFDEHHLVDLSDSGKVVAIEVLDPSHARLRDVAGQFGLLDLLPEMEHAVASGVPTSPIGTFAPHKVFILHEVHYAEPLAQFRVGLDMSASVPIAQPSELDLASTE